MTKISFEDKVNIYMERKKGMSVINLSKKYNMKQNHNNKE